MVRPRAHDYGLELTLCRYRHNVIYSGYRIIPHLVARRQPEGRRADYRSA